MRPAGGWRVPGRGAGGGEELLDDLVGAVETRERIARRETGAGRRLQTGSFFPVELQGAKTSGVTDHARREKHARGQRRARIEKSLHR